MAKFSEFVASGKTAKKFFEEVQTSDSIAGALGSGGITVDKGAPAIVADNTNVNVGFPLVDTPETPEHPVTEGTDPIGTGPAPEGTDPEPAKDLPLKEEGDPLGTGSAPEGTNLEPAKDLPLK